MNIAEKNKAIAAFCQHILRHAAGEPAGSPFKQWAVVAQYALNLRAEAMYLRALVEEGEAPAIEVRLIPDYTRV